jgi:hypothetical protein
VRGEAVNPLSLEEDPAGGRLQEAGNKVEEGGLAGAIGPDKAGDCALGYLKRAAVEGFQPIEAFDYFPYLQQ